MRVWTQGLPEWELKGGREPWGRGGGMTRGLSTELGDEGRRREGGGF